MKKRIVRILLSYLILSNLAQAASHVYVAPQPTKNNSGYIWQAHGPLTDVFVADIQKQKTSQRILFVGHGYNTGVIKALANATSEKHQLVINDVFRDHLKICRHLITELKLDEKFDIGFDTGSAASLSERFHLDDGRDRLLQRGRFDAIYAALLLHLMTPSEIMSFFESVEAVLKPGGKIYILFSNLSKDAGISVKQKFGKEKIKPSSIHATHLMRMTFNPPSLLFHGYLPAIQNLRAYTYLNLLAMEAISEALNYELKLVGAFTYAAKETECGQLGKSETCTQVYPESTDTAPFIAIILTKPLEQSFNENKWRSFRDNAAYEQKTIEQRVSLLFNKDL